jgi:hypothetical protein
VILILDTNAMFSRPELQGRQWSAVKDAVEEGALAVVVPRIVVAELTGRTRKERNKSCPTNRPAHNAPPAVLEAFNKMVEQVALWADGYDAEPIIRAAGFVIVPTPVIDHDALSQRAIDRIAPFDEGGNGYRDALHWHTVLNQLRAHPDEQVVFMSNDAGFRSSKRSGELDPHLAAEVAEILTTGTFALVRSLNDFEVPGKYAGAATEANISDEMLNELVDILFRDGMLHSEDLWKVMAGRDDALDADLSGPSNASVVTATVRPLAQGGSELQVTIRLDADVLFDWDYPDEASTQRFDITARFSQNASGTLLSEAAEDVMVQPVVVVPKGAPGNDRNGSSWEPRGATSFVFDTWLKDEIFRGFSSGAMSGGFASAIGATLGAAGISLKNQMFPADRLVPNVASDLSAVLAREAVGNLAPFIDVLKQTHASTGYGGLVNVDELASATKLARGTESGKLTKPSEEANGEKVELDQVDASNSNPSKRGAPSE